MQLRQADGGRGVVRLDAQRLLQTAARLRLVLTRQMNGPFQIEADGQLGETALDLLGAGEGPFEVPATKLRRAEAHQVVDGVRRRLGRLFQSLKGQFPLALGELQEAKAGARLDVIGAQGDIALHEGLGFRRLADA